MRGARPTNLQPSSAINDTTLSAARLNNNCKRSRIKFYLSGFSLFRLKYASMNDNVAVHNPNYETFREYVSQALIHRSTDSPSKSPLRRKRKASSQPDNSEKPPLAEPETYGPEELAEFIDV